LHKRKTNIDGIQKVCKHNYLIIEWFSVAYLQKSTLVIKSNFKFYKPTNINFDILKIYCKLNH